MSIKRPTDFPVKPFIDGSEEIYTQTGGINYKFTVNDVASLVLQGVNQWLYKEVTPSSSEWESVDVSPIQLLDENLLAPNEFYEVNRIICEVVVGAVSGLDKSPIYFLYKQNALIPLNTSSTIGAIDSTFYESTVNAVNVYYMEEIPGLFQKGDGLYLQSFIDAVPNDSVYTFKIYYRISS